MSELFKIGAIIGHDFVHDCLPTVVSILLLASAQNNQHCSKHAWSGLFKSNKHKLAHTCHPEIHLSHLLFWKSECEGEARVTGACRLLACHCCTA